jgi:hypothetical protein
MAQYNPRTVFRQTSNPLLREFFESKGHHIDVDWDETGNTQIQGIYEAFLNLSDADRRDLEIELHDIHTVAQSDDGIRILVENAVFMGHDIAGELEASDSRYDKAMIVLLRYPQVWDKAVTLVHADNLSKRCWYRRNTLPKQAPDISEPAMDMLIRDISAFYWQAQGRGQHCQIDHIQRSENQDYFFVYLSDHANTDLVLNETGEFQRVRRRCAFEVVFVFDRSMGVMDVFAHGGRQVIEPLQEIFAKAVIGVDLDPEDPEIPYWVEGLKDRSFQFVTDPEDGITQVAVRMLRMHPLGNKNNKLMVKLPSDAKPQDIYDWLDTKLDTTQLPISVLRVERATISMKLDGYGRKKSLTFDIGPKSCTLKSESERFRELGEKYLRKWELDRAE